MKNHACLLDDAARFMTSARRGGRESCAHRRVLPPFPARRRRGAPRTEAGQNDEMRTKRVRRSGSRARAALATDPSGEPAPPGGAPPPEAPGTSRRELVERGCGVISDSRSLRSSEEMSSPPRQLRGRSHEVFPVRGARTASSPDCTVRAIRPHPVVSASFRRGAHPRRRAGDGGDPACPRCASGRAGHARSSAARDHRDRRRLFQKPSVIFDGFRQSTPGRDR